MVFVIEYDTLSIGHAMLLLYESLRSCLFHIRDTSPQVGYCVERRQLLLHCRKMLKTDGRLSSIHHATAFFYRRRILGLGYYNVLIYLHADLFRLL